MEIVVPPDVQETKDKEIEKSHVEKGLLSRKSGRPIGSKSHYNMSEKALEVRSKAGFISALANRWKDGSSSRLLYKFGSCGNCPVASFCKEKNMNNGRGCDLVRQTFLTKLVELNEPAVVLLKRLAELETMVEIQQLRDGKAGIISKEYLELNKLAVELADKLSKMKHGEKKTVRHEFLLSKDDTDQTFCLNAEVEEDENGEETN